MEAVSPVAVCFVPSVVKGPERRPAPLAVGRADRRGECFEALDVPRSSNAQPWGAGEEASPAPLPRGERESPRGTPRPGASGALGTMAGSVDIGCREGDQRRSVRKRLSALQDVVAALMPRDRVSGCGRRPNGSAVSIRLRDGHAFAVGLQTCASVWLCPCCGRRIAAQRRGELNQLLAWARGRGLQVVMMTRTVRHHRHMALDWLFRASRAATKRFYQSREWRALKPFLQGHVTATECPAGANGFHPHTHTILLVKAQDERAALGLLGGLRGVWERCLQKEGLECNDHGFDIRGHAGAGDYISKWGVAEELTFSQAKEGARANKGRTPWQLLAVAGGVVRDPLFSSRQAMALWHEYAAATKGRRQLVWSRGLKAQAGIGEVSDQEAADTTDEAASEVARLSAAQWRAVVRHGLRATLLDRVEMEGLAGVAAVLRLVTLRGAGDGHE